MPGSGAEGPLHGRTSQAQRAGNPPWKAVAVSSILTAKYLLLVSIALMTTNLNFTCFGQQWFLNLHRCIFMHVCVQTHVHRQFFC